jgi:hypothetical protein
VKIGDIDGSRTLDIDGRNELLPDSVFITFEDHCIELDRATLMRAFMMEMGIWETVSMGAERYLQNVA